MKMNQQDCQRMISTENSEDGEPFVRTPPVFSKHCKLQTQHVDSSTCDHQGPFLLLLRQIEYVRMVRKLRKHSLECGNILKLEDYQLPESLKNKVKLLSCQRQPSKRKLNQNVSVDTCEQNSGKRKKSKYVTDSLQSYTESLSVSDQLIGLEKMFLQTDESSPTSDTSQLGCIDTSGCSIKVRSSQRRTCSMKGQNKSLETPSVKRHRRTKLLSDLSSETTEHKFICTSTPKVLPKATSKTSGRKKRNSTVTKLVHQEDGCGVSGSEIHKENSITCSCVDDITGTPLEDLDKSSDSATKHSSFDIQNNSISSVTDLSTLHVDSPPFSTDDASSISPVPDINHEGTRQRLSDRELFDPNLDVDICSPVVQPSEDHIMDDSDDELVNFSGFTPVKVVKPVQAGDVVWVKWKQFPFLPAYVKTMNKKTKRLTLVMFGPKEKPVEQFPMTFSAKTVVPFSDSRRKEFEAAGQSMAGKERADFVSSMDRVEEYLLMKALGRLDQDMSFFHDDTLVLAEKVEAVGQIADLEEEQPDDFDTDGGDMVAQKTTTTPSATQNKGRQKEPKELSKRGQIMVQKRTEKSQHLCDFLLSDEVKDYLERILNKSVPSELHNIFVQGSMQQRAKIKYQGFGPIDDEDQMENLVAQYIDWMKHKLPELQMVGYVCDVCVPEAIVYGLRKLRGYSKKKAWEMFRKGVRRSKEELELVHQEFLAKTQRRRSTAPIKKLILHPL